MVMYELLRMKNEGLREGVMAFAQELIDTPSPSWGEHELADKVARQMEVLGYHHVYRDTIGNVIGVIHGHEHNSTLLLNSHMDTHQTGEANQMHIEGDRIYGAGASDCKGGLAAQVFAGALLMRSLLPLRGTLVVTASVAEENGASTGVRTLMDQTLPEMGLLPDYAILGEPTNLGLYYGHDGWIEMDINIQGADPFQVDDAAGRIYQRFEAQTGRAHSGVHEVAIQAPVFPRESEGRIAVLRAAKRIQAADQAQRVLAETERDIDLLIQHRSSVTVSVGICREQQVSCTGHKMQVQHVTNAWATDPFDPLIDRSRQVLAAAGSPSRPGKWRLGRLGMGTAGATLLNEYNIPTIGYGPGNEKQAHRPDEWVDGKHVVQGVYGTAAIAHGLIGFPVCGWTSDEI
ncbi:hypothetical protein DO021_15870 [Desulfobacter hydrogenophilus]|uniref:M20/M25/M40 family metallo-hydrolase n=2 Tax=Desulfobacter hydrogenophilus TaxID=2291 RepID=A0A328FDD0_9BACT|nr:M20/M25/M40 family metallo-hydrolase [Desulfobacter hydrogenophilus]RAM01065.1 hypothetical protein DO021_15870 [Desulfobacter hydrogenophilus]